MDNIFKVMNGTALCSGKRRIGRGACRTAPAVDENTGWYLRRGRGRTATLVLPPSLRSGSKTVLQAAHQPTCIAT